MTPLGTLFSLFNDPDSKTFTLGSLVCVLVYVGINNYVEEQAAWHARVDAKLERLEAAQQRDDSYHALGRRFTGEDGDNAEGLTTEELEKLFLMLA